jgi:hypothetical protein
MPLKHSPKRRAADNRRAFHDDEAGPPPPSRKNAWHSIFTPPTSRSESSPDARLSASRGLTATRRLAAILAVDIVG